MYSIKSKIYSGFSKIQKSVLCNFLRSFVKKSPDFAADEIFEKFLTEEHYYFQINRPRFEFLQGFLEDENFLKETKLYIKKCREYYDYKKTQQPIIQANKAFEKQRRKFLQEVKMSKELPSKKQLYYYESLCKKYNINKKNVENLSKLDLKNLISEIIDEHTANSKNIN